MNKTYSHLSAQRRLPTEYELVTSRLLYYFPGGFEVNTPLQAWYERHQRGSPLQCRDWEKFSDPRGTTYSRYTSLQREKEVFVDGILKSIDEHAYDERLDSAWIAQLDRVLPVLRFPGHGLQMVAAYVGQMAPAGRIVIASLFQAADEMRRVQRIAYRMRQLRRVAASFGEASKDQWQRDSAWQPLRKTLEAVLKA